MKLELTDKEAEVIMQFVDIGLKQEGLKAIGAANMIIQKISEAQKVEKQQAETPGVANG